MPHAAPAEGGYTRCGPPQGGTQVAGPPLCPLRPAGLSPCRLAAGGRRPAAAPRRRCFTRSCLQGRRGENGRGTAVERACEAAVATAASSSGSPAASHDFITYCISNTFCLSIHFVYQIQSYCLSTDATDDSPKPRYMRARPGTKKKVATPVIASGMYLLRQATGVKVGQSVVQVLCSNRLVDRQQGGRPCHRQGDVLAAAARGAAPAGTSDQSIVSFRVSAMGMQSWDSARGGHLLQRRTW